MFGLDLRSDQWIGGSVEGEEESRVFRGKGDPVGMVERWGVGEVLSQLDPAVGAQRAYWDRGVSN